MISVKLPLVVSGKLCQADGEEDCRFVVRRMCFGLTRSVVCSLFNERLQLDEPGPQCYRCEKCKLSQIVGEQ